MPAKNEPQGPEFVVDGTFEDTEWRTAASKPKSQRTEAEQRTFEAGPRSHPYSSIAVLDTGDNGEKRWFPNAEAAQTWKQRFEAKRTSPKATVAASEGNVEKQVEAEKEGNKTRPVGGVA